MKFNKYRPTPLAPRGKRGRLTSLAVFRVAATVAALGIGASSSLATIVAVGGDVLLVAPPASVDLDQTESDVDIIGFNERQCFSLNNNLQTDQGVIPAGTKVSCHFFHMDPVNEPSAVLSGSARFNADVLGFISSEPSLDASDKVCRHKKQPDYPSVPTPGAEPDRGLEPGPDGYQVINGKRVKIQMVVPEFSDQLRVITRCQ
jgi:hypothetical protein